MAEENRRRLVAGTLVPLFIAFMGLAAFTNVASRPSFAAFRGVDVVGLMASGMCLGAAIAALLIIHGSKVSR
jgi:hypothetical protein